MKIKNIKTLKGEFEVVAVQTNSGWYKTHVGVSHNCDDM